MRGTVNKWKHKSFEFNIGNSRVSRLNTLPSEPYVIVSHHTARHPGPFKYTIDYDDISFLSQYKHGEKASPRCARRRVCSVELSCQLRLIRRCDIIDDAININP